MSSRIATRQHAQELREQATKDRKHRRMISIAAWTSGLIIVAALVTFGVLNSQPQETVSTKAASDFTLLNTSGQSVSLADYRGKNVILYFNEGAGCQACLMQMTEIEKNQAKFDQANTVVLPIVMNTREQITADMAANKVKTPFLLDDGTVSTAYGTIGKGMHAGLPGHSFVVIDALGTQRWYGEYPSMWLSADELLAQVKQALSI